MRVQMLNFKTLEPINRVLTIGRYPIPRKIWNIKTVAVAPYAALSVPIESSIDAMMKHTERPVAEIIRSARRPKRSTV